VPRTAKSQISFADWELVRQGISLEPFLQTISDFLEDHEEMIEAVRRDLERGLKNPETGRNGLTPSQVLRSFVLKSVKSWDYRELRERIADGYTLRQFTEFYCQPVPKHHAFNRAFHRLTPETVKAINELVVDAAVDLGLEDGNQLRVDTTVDVATLCYTSLSLRKHYLLPLATLLLRNPRLIPEIGGLFADRF
jgi:IS5 family transposase